MDFGTLLHVAKKNSKEANEKQRCYSTKFSPPKKEARDKKLSANIQKFLAKKEEEERKQELEKIRKRDELLAMRDTKSKNKINKMLKVIKSANKSVIADAVDTENTAVTLQGPDQPDEDDYGYVSQEASAFYSKMMEKYKSQPEENKFAPVRRKVTPVEVRKSPKESREVPQKRPDMPPPAPPKEEKPKVKKPPPPPVDFHSLLKLAEKKQFEPIEIVQEVKKKEKPERPMTQKEKLEHEERQAIMEAKKRRLAEAKSKGKLPVQKTPPVATVVAGTSKAPPPRRTDVPAKDVKRTPSSVQKSVKKEVEVKREVEVKKKPARAIPPETQQRTREFPPKDTQRAPRDQKSREFPPRDIQRSREVPRARPKPQLERRPPPKRPRIEDDDSEYDSEMDDFIDDGPEEADSYSRHIQEIFGYDKSRYRDEQEDDKNMESTFAQQMREEFISKKIGIMEDLEDMRQEELEKQQKLKSKKRRM
uniref:Protein SPT2 homolog n=1 Tax=Phlebotomus kandelakii TaxID=1109342 RepID=A0A6B2EH94_9DIPT